jgi:hypothetical protein
MRAIPSQRVPGVPVALDRPDQVKSGRFKSKVEATQTGKYRKDSMNRHGPTIR